MTQIIITNLSHPNPPVIAKLARSFFSKFVGLMFQKEISIDHGIVLAEESESRLNTSIHMLFMNFDICVVWLDKSYQVCDIQYAKKWRLAYFPTKSAQYVLELHPSKITEFHIGDQLQFEYEK
jgi:uncharacterized protein